METIVKAYAKINISLDVTGKRPDGYHELRSVMQTVSLADELALEVTDNEQITITSNLPYLAKDSRNLAYKAAAAFFSETGIKKGVNINIRKNIPIGAGLGGGSADSAAVFLFLNEIFSHPLTDDKLQNLALTCGADVPFCLKRGTYLAEGLGEILSPLPQLPQCYITIAKPEMSLGTKSVYDILDSKFIKHHPDTDGLIDSLNKGNLYAVAVRAYNVLEYAVSDRYKELDYYKGIMLDCGALGASMTGSGSAVFGIFNDENKAQRASSEFSSMNISSFVTIPLGE